MDWAAQLRLCRLMCGDGSASPESWPFTFRGYAAATEAQPQTWGERLPERHSLSAHRAAQPQVTPIERYSYDTNTKRYLFLRLCRLMCSDGSASPEGFLNVYAAMPPFVYADVHFKGQSGLLSDERGA